MFKLNHKYSLKYRFKRLNFKPDIAMVSRKTCIFIDGCFWHKCPKHFIEPKSNKEYWNKKINRNILRDAEINWAYKNSDWRIIRIWEHKLK